MCSVLSSLPLDLAQKPVVMVQSFSKCWLWIPAGSVPVHWGKVYGDRVLQTHKKRQGTSIEQWAKM